MLSLLYSLKNKIKLYSVITTLAIQLLKQLRSDTIKNSCSVVEVKSTVTPETAIKPIPFFSFQIRDLMNLPGNWNFKFAFNVHHELPEAVDAKEVVFEGINTTNFTFSHKDFIPNTLYDVYVSWNILTKYRMICGVLKACFENC